ncbi:MAG: hypothetical protein QE271_00005 [Bacteriovoracaceae bacterium]|nr:hypothetical protein [Bacteriovoracaceae bacterium]
MGRILRNNLLAFLFLQYIGVAFAQIKVIKFKNGTYNFRSEVVEPNNNTEMEIKECPLSIRVDSQLPKSISVIGNDERGNSFNTLIDYTQPSGAVFRGSDYSFFKTQVNDIWKLNGSRLDEKSFTLIRKLTDENSKLHSFETKAAQELFHLTVLNNSTLVYFYQFFEEETLKYSIRCDYDYQ